MASVRTICAHTLHVGGSKNNVACLVSVPLSRIHHFYHLLHLAAWHVPDVGPIYTLAQRLIKTTNSPENTIKTSEARCLHPRRLEKYSESLGQGGINHVRKVTLTQKGHRR